MSADYHKLDNPAWYALQEFQQDKILFRQNMACYHPDYAAFAAAQNPNTTQKDIAAYLQHTPTFFFIGSKPALPPTAFCIEELVCDQMVLDAPIELLEAPACVVLHESKQKQDLQALVQQIQPGYFNPKTAELGTYYGYYQQTKLIATAGERIQLDTFTELSAIVTHPEHRGMGWAKKLIVQATQQIFSLGKTPFLHVLSTNKAAIGLYQKLGFRHRRQISFWKIAHKPNIG